jgi:hypothetical protein
MLLISDTLHHFGAFCITNGAFSNWDIIQLNHITAVKSNSRNSTKVAIRLKDTPESIDYRCEIIE